MHDYVHVILGEVWIILDVSIVTNREKLTHGHIQREEKLIHYHEVQRLVHEVSVSLVQSCPFVDLINNS